jgi:alkylhydroperoxidase/carboxymuconolactone decarboxylase family protein YurZ
MTERADDLPSEAGDVARAYPAIWKAYSALGEACAQAGPIDRTSVRLVKLALAIGASSEGAVHSHVRRAMGEGVSKEEIKQVALLAIPTLGFPQAVRVLTWIEDITDKGKAEA